MAIEAPPSPLMTTRKVLNDSASGWSPLRISKRDSAQSPISESSPLTRSESDEAAIAEAASRKHEMSKLQKGGLVSNSIFKSEVSPSFPANTWSKPSGIRAPKAANTDKAPLQRTLNYSKNDNVQLSPSNGFSPDLLRSPVSEFNAIAASTGIPPVKNLDADPPKSKRAPRSSSSFAAITDKSGGAVRGSIFLQQQQAPALPAPSRSNEYHVPLSSVGLQALERQSYDASIPLTPTDSERYAEEPETPRKTVTFSEEEQVMEYDVLTEESESRRESLASVQSYEMDSEDEMREGSTIEHSYDESFDEPVARGYYGNSILPQDQSPDLDDSTALYSPTSSVIEYNVGGITESMMEESSVMADISLADSLATINLQNIDVSPNLLQDTPRKRFHSVLPPTSPLKPDVFSPASPPAQDFSPALSATGSLRRPLPSAPAANLAPTSGFSLPPIQDSSSPLFAINENFGSVDDGGSSSRGNSTPSSADTTASFSSRPAPRLDWDSVNKRAATSKSPLLTHADNTLESNASIGTPPSTFAQAIPARPAPIPHAVSVSSSSVHRRTESSHSVLSDSSRPDVMNTLEEDEQEILQSPLEKLVKQASFADLIAAQVRPRSQSNQSNATTTPRMTEETMPKSDSSVSIARERRKPKGRRSLSTGDATIPRNDSGSSIFSSGSTAVSPNLKSVFPSTHHIGFGDDAGRAIDDVLDTSRRGYRIRQHEVGKIATPKLDKAMPLSTSSGDTEPGQAWRRASDMHAQAAKLEKWRSQENNASKSKDGFVLLKIKDLNLPNLPIPTQTTYCTAVITTMVPRKDGGQVVQTPAYRLSNNCPLQTELEISTLTKDLVIRVEIKLRRDRNNPADSHVVHPQPDTISVNSSSSRTGVVRNIFSSPKKNRLKSSVSSAPSAAQLLVETLGPNDVICSTEIKLEKVLALGSCKRIPASSSLHAAKGGNGKIGQISYEFLHIPVPSAFLPSKSQSMDACLKALAVAEAYETETHRGEVNQLGGDCSSWRRRTIKVQGNRMIAWNEIKRENTSAILLSQVTSIEDVDMKVSFFPTHSSGPTVKGSAKTDRRPRSAASIDDEYEYDPYRIKNVFKLHFKNNTEISFYTDTPEQKAEWITKIQHLIGTQVDVPPDWARTVWQVKLQEVAAREKALPSIAASPARY